MTPRSGFKVLTSMLFSCDLACSRCCVCARITRCFWNCFPRRIKPSFSSPQATRRASSSLASFSSAADSMSALESVKQATHWVGTGEVSVQLSAISGKIGGGTGDGCKGTTISIGLMLMAKVADGLGGDQIVDFGAKNCYSYCQRRGKREDCLIRHCSGGQGMGWGPVGRQRIQLVQYRLMKHQAERSLFWNKLLKSLLDKEKTKNGGPQKPRVKHGTTAELRNA